MLMTRTHWLSLTIFTGLLTVGGIWTNNWLGQVSERVVASVNQQTGLRLADGQITFDLPERRLYVRDIDIGQPGIEISARRASVVLDYLNWWSPWFGDDFQSLSDIKLEDASITIDPPQLRVPEAFHSATIERGTLAIKGISQSVPFDQLRLLGNQSGEVQIHIDSVESWQFSGTYHQGLLSGELALNKVPLSMVLASDQPVGDLSGQFSLSWHLADGLSISGDARGAKGQLLLPEASVSWQQWQLHNMRFDSREPANSFAELSISGADLKLAAPAKIVHATDQLLPFTRISLTINDSRLEFGAWVFSHLGGTFVRDSVDDSWQYKLAARLGDVGAVQLSGQLGTNNDLLLQLNNARIAGPIADYGQSAGYRLQGARFNLSYDSQNRQGWIDFLHWPKSAAPLAALLTGPKNRARVEFTVKAGETMVPLPLQIDRAIGQRLASVAQTPLEYLNTVTGSGLELTLRHEAGQAALTPAAEQNLHHLKQIMAQRPALTAAIEVGVSWSRDRPELTRHGLEVALLELYQAMGGEEEAPPADVRGQLLEQMHLATQQKKIPEVGELTPEERVRRAEQWLLANWPVPADQLEMLQQARCELLKQTLTRIGLDAKRIELTKATVDEASEPDSTVRLR